jgi:hypothetical protein
VGDGRRSADDNRGRQQTGIPLEIGTLGDHHEVRVHLVERAEQTVYIPSDASAVGWDAGGVEQNERRTTVAHDRDSFPLPSLCPVHRLSGFTDYQGSLFVGAHCL